MCLEKNIFTVIVGRQKVTEVGL